MASRDKYIVGQESPLLDFPDPGGRSPRVPEVGTLTAGNLARHTANLDLEKADLAMKAAAYSRRQDARRQARRQRQSGASANNFLSNLPEVEADVQYRFNFVVVGPGNAAESVAKLTCSSGAAMRLLNNEEEPPASAGAVYGSSCTPIAHRCMCEVNTPGPGKAGGHRQTLTKLIFNPMELGKDVPTCANRLEALSTVIVFVLLVDGHAPDVNFSEQLCRLSQTVERNREQTHPKFRPVRAVILCDAGTTRQDSAPAEPWIDALADFERAHGDAWKFGPLQMQDGDTMHKIFTEMATTRISMGHGSEGGTCPPVAGLSLEEEAIEEGDPEAERLGQELLKQQMDARNSNTTTAGRCRASSRTSNCSEGWQRPPVFEAESDGSVCSDDALERHADLYGMRAEEDSAEAVPTSPDKNACVIV